jgi:hypothetical protein
MSLVDIAFLSLVISAFGIFSAGLAWASTERPRRGARRAADSHGRHEGASTAGVADYAIDD